MKYVKPIFFAVAAMGGLLFCQTSVAQAIQVSDPVTAAVAYTEGEVKRVDLSQGRITIKHGFIQNLEMPPMTMVFSVKEKSMLQGLSPGDHVRFTVISDNGKMVITELFKSPNG